MSKIKVGDRVRVRRCGYHNNSTTCKHMMDTSGGIYVVREVDGVPEEDPIYLEGYPNSFREGDLELVTTAEGEKVMGRRTFKLIKDMPGYKKGTLFQEQCEDGTQPYSVIEEPGRDPHYEVRLEFKNRSYVEDNPKWFVEVFQVHPQYMTREELDRWEAFNAKPATARKAKTVTARKKYEWTPERRKAHSARMKRVMKKYWAEKKAA